MKITVDIKGVAPKIRKLKNNSSLGFFVATTFNRYYSDYVPHRSGSLERNITLEPYAITHNMGYSAPVYFNDKEYNTDFNSKAQSHWAEACWKERKNDLCEEFTEYAKRL